MRNQVFHVRQTAGLCIKLLLSSLLVHEAAYILGLADGATTVWSTTLGTEATDDSTARNLSGK